MDTKTTNKNKNYNTRNNRNSNNSDVIVTTISKTFSGEIEEPGVVLGLKYERIDKNKSFEVFKEKLVNYIIKEFKNSRDVLPLVQDL